MTGAIDRFEGDFSFLSNFYCSSVLFEEISYSTVEHAFQAAKTLDRSEREKIAAAKTPGVAKRLGRRVKLREDWEQTKVRIMSDLLALKFSDPRLREALAATGQAILVEGNTWHDNFWGSCRCDRCGGKGRNTLGYLLMQLREELRPD
ncbi:MAG TPA: NADAR family protein [Blastocatellia bacterium]|nr:NADAR family protein [Blastocatellia bacterium]